LLRYVNEKPSAECEQVARAGLACAVVVCLVGVGETCEFEDVIAPPPKRQAQLDGAFEVADHLLEGLEVNLRGMCLSRAKDAQGCGDVWVRTNGRILEAA
jgi:hypothetical protein